MKEQIEAALQAVSAKGPGFVSMSKQRGRLVSIAGETGVGKTYTANFFNDPALTFFLDTEPVNTTTETLAKLGQEKVWKIVDWNDLCDKVDIFLAVMDKVGRKGTLVVDSSSPIKNMIKAKFEQSKGNKLAPFEFAQVNNAFREFLSKVTVDHGHDLIMTAYLKPDYSQNEVNAEGRITKYGQKTGSYSVEEWDELPYYCYYAFQIERGLTTADGTKAFPYMTFAKVRKTRATAESFKPLVVKPWTSESFAKQLSEQFAGGPLHVLAEIYKTTTDERFKAEAQALYGKRPEWVKLVGMPQVESPFKLSLG